MKKIDVLYTANKQYIDIMLSSIISLVLNANLNDLTIHIITSGFEKNDFHKIEKILNKYGQVDLEFYQIEQFNIDKYNIPNWRGSQIANARLFFQDILDKRLYNINNLLYLDSDTIIVSDLNGLQDYTDNCLNLVRNASLKSYYKNLYNLQSYYNSGVILVNVPNWLDYNCQDKVIDFIENNAISLTYPDQDILNCALKDNISDLPLNYNMYPSEFIFNQFLGKMYFNDKLRNIGYEEVQEAKMNPKIIHSCGMAGIKPWSNNKVNPFTEEYMKYIQMANPNFVPEELNSKQRFFNMNQSLLNLYLILITYMPSKAQSIINKLSLIMQNNPSQQKTEVKKYIKK